MPGVYPVPKVCRVDDPAAVEAARRPKCEVCRQPAHGLPHHIVTVGARGPDMPENLIQLCWECHYVDVPGCRLTKMELFGFVALRMMLPVETVIARIEKAMGRGIKL